MDFNDFVKIMDSRRRFIYIPLPHYLGMLLAVLLMAGCATPRQTGPGTAPGGEQAPADTVRQTHEEGYSQRDFLNANRSSLRDLHATQVNDLPKGLMQERVVRETQVDSTAGFRIQILSTRDIAVADSVASRFRVWADTALTGYQAETYQYFQQPFYKVHVGDFLDRRRAIEYSRLVQSRFPEAWVVHDRIEPGQVPADTTTFGFREVIRR